MTKIIETVNVAVFSGLQPMFKINLELEHRVRQSLTLN